ncbi:hypothetical protein [Thermoproteus tenax]|uniref:Uncharacterized protein n=1 Tax=Thermoproteus tenax (strain ATCC 35583 / DSM 2078 / JCM 9277 / NBRC 100435 / Kra 1) TaxID=768679 RepID=G4RMQ0_THETK|nr:hypothetical protein [Thermoproteus tenax]CCC82726.1 hypothetical protein TTX_2114 [Thermoproteus tenax Kra 1]
MYWAVTAALIIAMAMVIIVTIYTTGAMMQQAQQNTAEYGTREVAIAQQCANLPIYQNNGKYYISAVKLSGGSGVSMSSYSSMSSGGDDEYGYMNAAMVPLQNGQMYLVGNCVVEPMGSSLLVFAAK